MSSRLFFAALALILAVAPGGFSQEGQRLPIEVSAAANWFFAPGLFAEDLQPLPGIRAGLGYELGRFSFGRLVVGLEAGFSAASGKGPLTESAWMAPALARLSYYPALRLFGAWGLRADLGAGLFFAGVDHYQNSLGQWLGDKAVSQARLPAAEAKIYLSRALPANLALYAGGGLDLLFESSKAIALPGIQAGITFQPSRPAPRPVRPAAVPIALPPPPTTPGRSITALYFEPNGTTVMERHIPELDEAGRYLRDNPTARVTLRGYSALFGEEAGRREVSQARALYVRDYLAREYGISADRMTVEFYGADRAPELDDGTWESYRVVEMTFGWQ
ncbi:MAG: OmpA family protein [Treponema sp.]|nr:OmpA family protein [Treponema sp.]